MAVSRDVVGRLAVSPAVAAALATGAPVVALESTLISHGLPHPQNLEVASPLRPPCGGQVRCPRPWPSVMA
jgi:pseudouridine-5'-phosphate glycosidase